LRGKFSVPITEFRAGDQMQFGWASVRAVPAYNTPAGRSSRKQHRPGDGLGYVVEVAGWRLYHAGDTDLIPEMGELGPIDSAFLPVGGVYTMDATEAAEAAALVRPKQAVAMHFLNADPQAFRQAVHSLDPAIEVVIPVTGQVVSNV
jgi:L-ascorbate metabolism protein UlaG (beta-lactamase superfamily)